ncbi:hypothetical protein ERO13_D08G214400v2 [Gossypium hirsutum]|uniref:Defensin-like protein n=3 Tax=Gossypium TaxID=3633 RepID=A0A5J5QHF2_GOSBA|nr:hypothetical protein ES319_D08G235100v1 [Gossypium barbadense]KAG4135432.1 hypothetical protein ERO13_D08G214400v2 [Gossypium hirsutum]TYH59792.1 hypothetical protein ES332_D08G245700v1 [Gossypium tomentosum]TYI70677.1 hypothetical protein E1A91_D08G238100v1 [Gossypium mustelinum]
MASFGVACFFIVLIVAFGVSNSEACTHDSECQLNCDHLGLCDLKTNKCSCLPVSEPLPFDGVPMANAKCSTDDDCKDACPPNCTAKCFHCFCLCYCSA